MTKAFNMEDHFDGDWQEVPADEDECDEATQYEAPFEGSSEEMTMTSFHRGSATNTKKEASSQPSQFDVGREGISEGISRASDPYALLDLVCPTEDREQSELRSYLSSTSTADDVLTYWQKHEKTFPRLAKLAVVCLGAAHIIWRSKTTLLDSRNTAKG
ncbi:hypothetical protein MRX96_009212 [Rhipicephalus microplus]